MRRTAATAPPPVQSKGGPRSRQASPRVLWSAAGGAAAVVLVIVLAIVLSGGGGSGSSGIPIKVQSVGSIGTGLPGAAAVDAMFKGIPQSGFELGSPFAPVHMIEYIDLQCPICRDFETTTMTTIVPKYVRTGKLRVEVRPWAFIGPDSFRGQAAVDAAALQNKAFNYAQLLYDNQGTENTGWLSNGMVYQIAIGIPGLAIPKFLADRGSGTVKSDASNVAAQAQADGVNGTPTVFVGKSGSKPKLVSQNEPTLQQMEQAIQAALT